MSDVLDPLHEALLDLETALGRARSEAERASAGDPHARQSLRGALTVMSDALWEAFDAHGRMRRPN